MTGYTITLKDGTTFREADFGQMRVHLMSDGSVDMDLFTTRLAALDGVAPLASISFSSTAVEEVG